MLEPRDRTGRGRLINEAMGRMMNMGEAPLEQELGSNLATVDALELRTRDRERKLLKKIEQAIARIDSGDYGYCEETGEPIGVGRLMARPTASLSLEAQQRRELKQKMFGD